MITKRVFKNEDGMYPLPHEVVRPRKQNYYFSGSGDAAVFRNGLLMTPGVDYIITLGNVEPLWEWDNSDIVSLLFEIRE